MARILKYGDPRLKKISEEVLSTEDWKNLESIMYNAYVSAGKTQGLAAPQFGLLKRIVTCRLKGVAITMFNPEVLCTFGKKKSNEGCESVVDRYIVNRPILGKVRYYDANRVCQEKWYTWRQLRVICHEIDHLNGICICDIGERWQGGK